ncbi:hypothetical protein H257_10077 [Aphanomyces astaci]|uniref:Lipid A biosynthesis lauroyl acyltransferase n=1 Tax=Aphanomyces astaci TaxID=112090 RepID=W4G9G8_APHAT|nr:hypothetical protein H257_10077 [Aphanomyces astaci]ETV75689.1 hypothetical protein H257_10077 [Aphanomyces astaci]|eukprot:XP_009834820.1 hypothetical protein H257_10077 [Aphanomyces astaci]
MVVALRAELDVKARRRWQLISDHVVTLTLRSLALAVGLLPPFMFVPLGRLFGRIGHAAGLRRNIVKANIALSFPTMSAVEQKRLVRETYENTCVSLLWFLHIRAFGRWQDMERYVDVAFPREYVADLRNGPVIVTSAHLGCWELLPCVHAPPNLLVDHVYELYRPLHNLPLNKWLLTLRSYPHTRLLPDKQCLTALTTILTEKSQILQNNNADVATPASAIVALVCDQRPSRSGVLVSFRNRPTIMAPGAAVLHLRTGRPVWCTALVLAPAGHPKPFLLHTLPVIRHTPGNEEKHTAQTIMELYASTVSSLIETYPSQYLWLHALWK